MKGKKHSAFSVFQGKSQNQQNISNKPPHGSSDNNAGLNKSSRKRSFTAGAKTPKAKTNGFPKSPSYNNLDKSPNAGKLSRRTRRSYPYVLEGIIDSEAIPKPIPQRRRRSKTLVKSPDNNDTASFIVDEPAEIPTKRQKTGGLLSDEQPMSDSSGSRVDAKICFEWLIHPVKAKKFFDELWEKKPLLVKHHHNTYYKGIMSSEDMDTILREKVLLFGKNIDVTTYANGKRETHNPAGRAYPAVVWDFYQNGCSVRMLNPQTFSKSVWKLCAIMQEYFGSGVGANIYLTPPGSQGFAPHYDDIEAFVLQLEGKKRWKLYSPRSPAETLPRFSSGNFSPEEIGEPILNIVLEPGDLLYFPRGTIHQASTLEGHHSLHITMSTCQRNSWGDFFEKLLPTALQLAMEEDLEFRESLPKDYLDYMGVAHSDRENEQRTAFLAKVAHLTSKLLQQAPVDACVDQVAKGFIHNCLPPVLTKVEKKLTIASSPLCLKQGRVMNHVAMEPKNYIRLLRANILRLVTEENAVRIYYSSENSREYHGEDLQFLEISPEMAPAVEALLHAYPSFLRIDQLPIDELEERMSLAASLFERGLIMTQRELKPAVLEHAV